MLLRDFICEARLALTAPQAGSLGYSPEECKALVARLCTEVLGVESYAHIIEPDLQVPEASVPFLHDALRRLLEGEPLQYILGYEDFMGHRFKVSPSVLIPRPETEILCREALAVSREGDRALDLCTGSGCIAWTLSLAGLETVGIDISPEALAVASSQPLEGPAPRFVLRNVLDGPSDFEEGEFDLIVSNPPYVRLSEKVLMRRNVLDYEPSLALFVEDDDPLVFYRAVASYAQTCLRPGGHGFVEINEALGEPTAAVFSSSGFSDVRILRDFDTKMRVIAFRKPQ
ncbi:MAG: peptide chain release factor N(5)-glutamine methyltransferase [Candidatus Cryptobacteroides sp.]